ncbi:MAG TPA: mobilization protein, partial [Legionellaceae bacterium]|nr:mobilization protein [Legionellaceae bacterium]
LKLKKERLHAQIQKLEASEKSRERKRDTRRKILIGSYFLDKAKEEGGITSLYQAMESYLKRETDKQLFQPELLKN